MNNDKEIWKPAVGFESYEVSNFGNIRHRDLRYRKLNVTRNIGNNMVYVTLRDNTHKKKYIALCRVIAKTFINDYNDDDIIAFIDNDTTNCAVSNLVCKCNREEEWRYINGFEGLYEVSNLGRVRAVSRIINVIGYNVHRNPIIRKISKKKNGYYGLTIMGKNLLIHRIVADAFIPNPNKYPQINHKNEDKSDNRVENLEWCSAKYNSNYGTRVERLKKSNPKMKGMKVLCVNENGGIIKRYNTIRSVSNDGHNPSLVHLCCRKQRNSHHGYRWMFEE